MLRGTLPSKLTYRSQIKGARPKEKEKLKRGVDESKESTKSTYIVTESCVCCYSKLYRVGPSRRLRCSASSTNTPTAGYAVIYLN